MKIVLLAAGHSIHSIRWVNGLVSRGYEVHLVTMHRVEEWIEPRIKIHYMPIRTPLGYFLNAPWLRRLLKDLNPDLLHAHYASGYGTLGRLSSFHPYVLSVWGSDIYDWPYTTPIHHRLMVANLRSADCICSTSNVMAEQTRKIYPDIPKIVVTPFGIDTECFHPLPKQNQNGNLVIGTVKTLHPKYGIDVLIRAYAKAMKEFQPRTEGDGISLKLMIVGGGPLKTKLVKLAKELNLGTSVNFTGAVSHEDVPEYLNQFDVYVAASRLDSESFGVAILEASACGLPVVVSNVGGLPEVVVEGETGFIIEKENVDEFARAIRKLADNKALRAEMGEAGRRHVVNNYQWVHSLDIMEGVYNGFNF